MKISGPFLDKKKKGQPKPWFLRVVLAKLKGDGTAEIDAHGHVAMRRWRPYYPSRAKAEEDIPSIEATHGAAGSGRFLFNRTAATEYEAAKAIVPEGSLADVARFFRKHHPGHKVETISELVPTFIAELEARVGKSKYWRDLKTRTKLIAGHFGGRTPGLVTRGEFIAWLRTYPGQAKSGRTVANIKSAGVAFFEWLRDQGKVDANPLVRIKRAHLPKYLSKEIRFLKLEEAEIYLRAAERYDPELVAHEIVQLLAGVRADDEMANFNGDWVFPQTKEVTIPAAIAKTEEREVINTLEPVFWEWWKAYGRGGILRPRNYLKRWTRLRTLAHAWCIQGRDQADEMAVMPIKRINATPAAAAALEAWPWNARRRTFCTYKVAKDQSAAAAALILRHRGDAYTLHNSYRGRGVTQAQGVTYFSWRPTKVTAPILPKAPPPRGVVRLQLERRLLLEARAIA